MKNTLLPRLAVSFLYFHQIYSLPWAAKLFDSDRTILIDGESFKVIPDDDTLQFLGFDKSKLDTVQQSNLSQFIELEGLQSMKHLNYSPDEITRVHMLKFVALLGGLKVEQIRENFPKLDNPMVQYWRGKFLMIMPGWWAGNHDGIPLWCWLDSDFQLDEKTPHFGIGPGLTSVPSVPKGEDPRILIVDDLRFYVIYIHSSSTVYEKYRMQYFEVRFNELSQSIEVGQVYILNPVNPNENQKNWVPFMYDDKLMVLDYVDPLHVAEIVHPTPGSNTTSTDTIRVSSNPPAKKIWDYGSLRGGTPAYLIDDDRYFAFFHTKDTLPKNVVSSYFMGAYTFMSKPPFSILSMSPTPIVRPEWYDGSWYGKKIDYVVFPISYTIVASDNENVVYKDLRDCDRDCLSKRAFVVTVGGTYRLNWIKLNALQLFDSLVAVG